MQLMDQLRADRLVWIFGTGRSGSTWLGSMMGDMAGGRLWNEPLVGKLFGDFHSDARPKSLRSKNFVMAEAHRSEERRVGKECRGRGAPERETTEGAEAEDRT